MNNEEVDFLENLELSLMLANKQIKELKEMAEKVVTTLETQNAKVAVLEKEYAAEINKRVPVEQRLLDSARGAKPLPDKEDCLKMAQILGRDQDGN